MNKPKPIVPTKGTDWNLYGAPGSYGSLTLPPIGQQWAIEGDIMRSGFGSFVEGAIFYKGESPEKATDWIMVTDDGSYYKVDATYMTWYTSSKLNRVVGIANWSESALKKNLKSIMTTGRHSQDPDYQT